MDTPVLINVKDNAVKKESFPPAIHPKVAVGLFVGAVTSFILHILKLKFDIDLADQEPNLVVIITAIASYLMPS